MKTTLDLQGFPGESGGDRIASGTRKPQPTRRCWRRAKSLPRQTQPPGLNPGRSATRTQRPVPITDRGCVSEPHSITRVGCDRHRVRPHMRRELATSTTKNKNDPHPTVRMDAGRSRRCSDQPVDSIEGEPEPAVSSRGRERNRQRRTAAPEPGRARVEDGPSTVRGDGGGVEVGPAKPSAR